MEAELTERLDANWLHGRCATPRHHRVFAWHHDKSRQSGNWAEDVPGFLWKARKRADAIHEETNGAVWLSITDSLGNVCEHRHVPHMDPRLMQPIGVTTLAKRYGNMVGRGRPRRRST